MPDVFISYSTEDAAVASAICSHLESADVECWIAPRDPVPGIPYGRQLTEAIDSSRILLLVLSAASNASRAVLHEIELASNRGKVILPCRIEDVMPSRDLEFYVRAVHWFTATNGSIEQQAPDLVALVQRVLQRVSDRDTLTDPSGASLTHNLPSTITSFVGRTVELAEIRGLCETSRLVSIVGAGGIGKTRIAVRIGQQIVAEDASFPIWLVELAPLSDASLIAGTIASVLGIPLPALEDPLFALAAALRAKNLLLILDNCEHLIEQVGLVASTLLRQCPHLSILATSRQGLGVSGETVYRMPSLADPEAIALFTERARAVSSKFSLAGAHEAAVAEICRRLDGIALAIELAAARMNVLNPQQLCRELEHRFQILSGGGRDLLPRHRTLHATIDWSYDLLDDREKALFRRTGIFVGGFTVDAATAVCIDDARSAVFDLVVSLVDKSLVVADLAGDMPRYKLLESTRAYAREKLEETNEFDTIADRHAAYVSEMFAKVGAEYDTTMSGRIMTELAPELDEARSVLDWTTRHGNVAAAADLFVATRLWDHLGLHHEAVERARRYIELIGETDIVRLARLWERIALLVSRTGHYAMALDAAQHAVAYARNAGDAPTLADALARYGYALLHARRFDEAQAALDEAEGVAPPTPRLAIQIFTWRGLIARLKGDLAGAARCAEDTREFWQSMGNDLGVVSSSITLAEIEYERGETALAISAARNALPEANKLPDRGVAAWLLRNLTGYLAAANEVAAAREAGTEAAVFYEHVDPGGVFAAVTVEHLALIAALEGDFERAVFLEGYADKALRTLGFEREYTEEATRSRVQALLRLHFSDEDLAGLLARGAAAAPRTALVKAMSRRE
jgi:predicted ATPase